MEELTYHDPAPMIRRDQQAGAQAAPARTVEAS